MKSIKDIAKKANVSTGTVDRVIHNRAGVSATTRKKILKIIKESNFSINPVASSLASKKSYTIASLIPTSDNSEFWKLPHQGIYNQIQKYKTYGFKLKDFYFDQFSVESYEKAFKKLLTSNPSAVVIAPVFLNETKKYIKRLDDKKIPYIFINIEIEDLNNISFVGQSSYKGGYLAGKMMQLYTPTTTDIGIIKIRENTSNYYGIEQRILGFTEYLKANNATVTSHEIKPPLVTSYETLNNTIINTLSKKPSIDAFFVPSSESSKIAHFLDKNKLSHITLIGFDTTTDNINYLRKGTINALIGQQPQKQGSDGIDILFNLLINKNIPLKKYYSPLQIVVKENVDYID